MTLVLAQDLCEAVSVEARHIQVEKNEARAWVLSQAVERFEAVRGAHWSAAPILEAAHQRLSDARVVFDDEDATSARHTVNVAIHSRDCQLTAPLGAAFKRTRESVGLE